jgi:hypothetical protein
MSITSRLPWKGKILRTHVPLFSHLVAILTSINVNRGSAVRKSDEEAVLLSN